MESVIKSIEAIVAESARMSGAYFFHAPSTAGGRRAYERMHSHDRVEWTEGGHAYSAEYNVRCSCNNVYAAGLYTKDGVKTNLLAIRNSLKRLQAVAEEN